ncbi:hypothetical protein FACS189418_2460 [Clostridia bacterium]|nr:hypothetical protein FACS189418_2460 [Clostridia bacterium]
MKEEYLLVDGYNIIFAWSELQKLAKDNLESARGRLQDILCNYQGFCQNEVIVVFDGHLVSGNLGTVYPYHNIQVIFTKEAETADQYIEKTIYQFDRKRQIRVATSDRMEQMIILGSGAFRISAQEFYREVKETSKIIQKEYLDKTKRTKNLLFDYASPDLAKWLENIRLNKK